MFLAHTFLPHISPLKVLFSLTALTTLFEVSFADSVKDILSNEPRFAPNDLFPAWEKSGSVIKGVAGRNSGLENELFLGVLPNLIDLMMQFVAPAVFVMMVFAGLRFIYAQDDEEQRTKAKSFFMYTVIGLLFILLSYSIMRAVYFIFAA